MPGLASLGPRSLCQRSFVGQGPRFGDGGSQEPAKAKPLEFFLLNPGKVRFVRLYQNHLGQPVGQPVESWTGAVAPPREIWSGSRCRLEPLDPDRHAVDLFAAQSLDREGRSWTYLSYGPPASFEEHRALLSGQAATSDPLFFAIIDRASDRAVGVCSYLRIFPELGSIEIGHLYFSPLLQRTSLATEAIYLMLRRAFDELGYRRCEWKCNSLNEASRAAAERYGFSYEGLFRQSGVSKGRNRDTAWYSILDREWNVLRPAYEMWLAAANFDAEGGQRQRLSALVARARDVENVLHTVHAAGESMDKK